VTEPKKMNTSKDGKVRPTLYARATTPKRFTYRPGKRATEFLLAKGAAFRSHWSSKFKNGMTEADIKRFDGMVDEFHGTEEP
jgi:hypothetical protein